VTVNSLFAAGKLYIYEVNQDMSAFIDPDEAERIRQKLVENRITTLQLTNRRKISAYTRVVDIVRHFW